MDYRRGAGGARGLSRLPDLSRRQRQVHLRRLPPLSDDVDDGNIVCIEGIPGTSTALDYAHYPIVDGQVQVPDLPGFAMPLKEE